MTIYRAGIIDSHGKFLKDADQYKTQSERVAGSAFNRLIVILKRAILTSADPRVRWAAHDPAAALSLIGEEVEAMGGNKEQFLSAVSPLFEEGMSVGGGGIAGIGVSASKPEDVVVTPKAVKKHKKRIHRRLFEDLLNEAKKKTSKKVKKKKNRVVETTGHMTHVGDFLYYGQPDLAIKHLEAVHRRFRGQETPEHTLSLKADGGMSVVLKRHKDGTAAVAYKSGAAEYKTPEEIKATGKEHLVRELTPALELARRSNLKPGTAVQGDLLFTSQHRGHVQPNTITYHAPKEATIGFAPHSGYATDGLNLRKTTSNPEPFTAEGAFVPNLGISGKTKLSITPERDRAIGRAIHEAGRILSSEDLRKFMVALPSDKKFHRMLQEYSNHAARTSGRRTTKDLEKFIPVYMGKQTQKKLSEKTRRTMSDTFVRTIRTNQRHLDSMFTAHGHINTAKHAILDQFATHHDQFELRPHSSEHEGIVSSLGVPGRTETQAKFVREGEKGFAARNAANAAKRFGTTAVPQPAVTPPVVQPSPVSAPAVTQKPAVSQTKPGLPPPNPRIQELVAKLKQRRQAEKVKIEASKPSGKKPVKSVFKQPKT